MTRTPKKIWQTWKSNNPSQVPLKLYRYTQKWKKLHPDYEYHLLDDDEIRTIVREVVPHYLDDYDGFTHTIERVDFARYALLKQQGGVYADLDTNPLKSIDVWVNKNKIVFGCEPKEHAEKLYGRNKVICNALMISPPGEEFWKDLMDFIIDNYEHRYRPVENTGPLAITKFLESPTGQKYTSQIIVTDPCVFYPLKRDNTVSKECDIKESYVEHVWENTWVKPWYQDPMWFNARYWTWGLIIVFVALWLWCYYHNYGRSFNNW